MITTLTAVHTIYDHRVTLLPPRDNLIAFSNNNKNNNNKYVYIYRQDGFVEFPSATSNVAADTGYVIYFVSSQHEVDNLSFLL